MKEVTYLKNKNGGKWVLLSLIGPLETDKDKAIRLKNERQMRDWMAFTPVSGTIHAGMWTQLIIAQPPVNKKSKVK
jgi:hypothetical protein